MGFGDADICRRIDVIINGSGNELAPDWRQPSHFPNMLPIGPLLFETISVKLEFD